MIGALSVGTGQMVLRALNGLQCVQNETPALQSIEPSSNISSTTLSLRVFSQCGKASTQFGSELTTPKWESFDKIGCKVP